jgi:hypothetical protein
VSSVPATTNLLLEIRDRTDESCPYLGTLLGLLALAEGVLRIAASGDNGATFDAFEMRDEQAAAAAEDGGLTIALGAIALSQQLVGSCAAASRPKKASEPAAPEASSFTSAEDDPWCDALV